MASVLSAVTTVVRSNFLGRIYMAPVTPLHKLIARGGTFRAVGVQVQLTALSCAPSVLGRAFGGALASVRHTAMNIGDWWCNYPVGLMLWRFL